MQTRKVSRVFQQLSKSFSDISCLNIWQQIVKIVDGDIIVDLVDLVEREIVQLVDDLLELADDLVDVNEELVDDLVDVDVQLVDDLPEHDRPPVPRDAPGDDVGGGAGCLPGPANCSIRSTQWVTRTYARKNSKFIFVINSFWEKKSY